MACGCRYGDMCKPREHGARAVEILPEQRAAIVNFASYEHACNALKGLQGALIGKITRPGLVVAWHKRQEEQQRQPAMAQEQGWCLSILTCLQAGNMQRQGRDFKSTRVLHTCSHALV